VCRCSCPRSPALRLQTLHELLWRDDTESRRDHCTDDVPNHLVQERLAVHFQGISPERQMRVPVALQHSTAQHSTAQHSTAQHSTAQHSTAQHSTAQQQIRSAHDCRHRPTTRPARTSESSTASDRRSMLRIGDSAWQLCHKPRESERERERERAESHPAAAPQPATRSTHPAALTAVKSCLPSNTLHAACGHPSLRQYSHTTPPQLYTQALPASPRRRVLAPPATSSQRRIARHGRECRSPRVGNRT
jgi:hypothetical protein